MKRILSLGAGVQSSTLALMAARGEIEPVDCAIFADTGAEPLGVMKWLDWLESELNYPVYRVKEADGILENIKGSCTDRSKRPANPPVYTKNSDGSKGMLRRVCTSEFKIKPITQKVRELVGMKPGQRGKPGEVLVTQLIGISLDEVQRMKDSHLSWIQHEWPLIDRRMSRHDCKMWMDSHGYPEPPKSACTFCPFHNDDVWREMKASDPVSFEQAVEVDEMMRDGLGGTSEKLYLHRSLKPLREVDFRNEYDMGQLDFFNNECEGMCGV